MLSRIQYSFNTLNKKTILRWIISKNNSIDTISWLALFYFWELLMSGVATVIVPASPLRFIQGSFMHMLDRWWSSSTSRTSTWDQAKRYDGVMALRCSGTRNPLGWDGRESWSVEVEEIKGQRTEWHVLSEVRINIYLYSIMICNFFSNKP
jgi:hypothetical protein